MASTIEICNAALLKIGSSRITSLDDDSVAAAACKSLFAMLRNQVLEEADWSFAIRRVILAPDSTTPAWNYSNRFKKPTNCLRVITARDNPDEQYNNLLDWSIENDYILADTEVLYVKYVSEVADTTTFSPLFVAALTALLAHHLATQLANSPTLAGNYYQIYIRELSSAKSSDGIQGRNRRIRTGRLVERRR